jgi:hypothetical protein
VIRFLGRAIVVCSTYIAVLLAVVIAGFIGQRVGIWASVLWGALLIACVVLYSRRRGRRASVDP